MGWVWNDLDKFDEWDAAGQEEPTRRAVLEALAQLMDQADVIEGSSVPGEQPLVRRITVAGVDIIFLRAEQFRTLRLLKIRRASS